MKDELKKSNADLLSLIVKYWKDGFSGTSALYCAEVLSIDHEQIIKLFNELKRKGYLSLRKSQLSQGVEFEEIKVDNDTVARIPTKWEMIDTLIAFPKKHILEEIFQSENKDFGVFSNRLHKGASQIQHYYFRREVLDKYHRQPDKYHFHDDTTGGNVGVTTEYYLSLPENVRDAQTFGTIEYGNLTLIDDTEAVGVIAKDLDYLPKEEQHYWAAFEIIEPVINQEDKSWSDYIRESFEGDWDVEHIDYIEMLNDLIVQINTKKNNLFNGTANPNLRIPVMNVISEYTDAHKELYKLIGPDNISSDALEQLLLNLGYIENDLINKDSGKKKGKWALLKMLVDKVGADWTVFENIAENRIRDAHKIQELTTPVSDHYPRKFRHDLSALIVELNKILS